MSHPQAVNNGHAAGSGSGSTAPAQLQFGSVEELQRHHRNVQLSEGRRARERHLYCQEMSFYALLWGMAGGLVAGYVTVRALHTSYPLMFGPRRGRLLVVGALGSLGAFGASKFTHDRCLENHMRSMRLVAERRHQHYMEQLLKSDTDGEGRAN